MENILAGAIGASVSLIGVMLGAWFNARRQDRMWIRDQKLKGAVDFVTAGGQLYDQQRGNSTSSDHAPTRKELVARMQDGRSVLYLLCSETTVDLAEELARKVFRASPAISPEEHGETMEALRRLNRQLRSELGA
jgi:hypothetical protein